MPEEEKSLLNSALRYLGYRPRSKKEIIDFLSKKTNDENLINQTVEKLESLKLISDSEFTDWLVKSRSRNRGSLFIRQDLKKRGIDVKNMQLETNDLDTAVSLLHKKSDLWSNLSFQEYRLKAFRYLSYRGFPASVIAKAVKKVYNRGNVS